MEIIITSQGDRYKINGQQRTYIFKYKRLYAHVEKSAFKFPENITVYIFYNDNKEGKPILIDIDFTNKSIIPFGEVDHFPKIKKYAPMNFLYLSVPDSDEGRRVVEDIIAGSDFEMKTFNSD